MAQVLVIGPHPDDQELGMGGTIARLAAQGHDVLLLDMTDGSPTPHGTRETRLPEARAALAHLSPGAAHPRGKPVRRTLLDLPNRRVEHTLAARHLVAGAIRAHQATILFVPHPQDAHPDHLAVTRIVTDARFDAKLTNQPMPGDEGKAPLYPKWLFHYYCSHLRRVPDPTFVIDTTGFADAKMGAIGEYRTQFGINPLNAQVLDWIRAGDRYFGSRIGTVAGEAFSSPEPLGLDGLGSLVP